MQTNILQIFGRLLVVFVCLFVVVGSVWCWIIVDCCCLLVVGLVCHFVVY